MAGRPRQDSHGHSQAELPTPSSTHSYWHRDPSRKLLDHHTTKDLPSTADVVVIGSGITGAFAARELVAGGKSVVMLEAREACWGATGRVSFTSIIYLYAIYRGANLSVIEWRPLSAWRLEQST